MRAGQPRTNASQRLDDPEGAGRFVDDASRVGDLAARFQIERRPRDDDEAALTRVEAIGRLPLLVEQGEHGHAGQLRLAVALELVADSDELRLVRHGKPLALATGSESALRPRLVALAGHGALVALTIDSHVLRRRGVLDEIERDAERVVQLERGVARQHSALGPDDLCGLRLQLWKALGQHGLAAMFFGENRLPD